jgi:hypothetical protein
MTTIESAIETLLFVNDMEECKPSKELTARLERELDFFFTMIPTDDNFSDKDKNELASDFICARCETGFAFHRWTDKEFAKKCNEVSSSFIKLEVYTYRNRVYSLSFNMLKNIISEALIKWDKKKDCFMLKFIGKGEQWRRVYDHSNNGNWSYIKNKEERFHFRNDILDGKVFIEDEAIKIAL